MFGQKKKKDNKNYQQVEKVLSDSLYKTVCDTLLDVLKTDYKITDKEGKEVTDYEMTVRMIRTKARVALDFVSNLKTSEENKNIGE